MQARVEMRVLGTRVRRLAGCHAGRGCTPLALRVVRHDGEEFLLIDLAILVEVEFVNHCLPRGQPTRLVLMRDYTASGEQLQVPGGGYSCGANVVGEWVGSTHNSSSSSLSPISFATRRRFRKLIFPVLSSSKSWNALRISSIGSRARIRSLTSVSG